MQTVLKATKHIMSNKNKTFPIGNIQTVKQTFEELNLPPMLDDLKHCGHLLSSLIIGMVSYKLTEDHSTIRCHKWMNNNPLLLQELHLDSFGKDALYRGLRIIGRNRHQILHHLLFTLKNQFGIGLDMVFMDWTSIHFEAKVSNLVQYGKTRDHRPDRPRVTMGFAVDETFKDSSRINGTAM